jgi:hypothetical protein
VRFQRESRVSQCAEKAFVALYVMAHPGGRPTKRTPEITERITEALSYGLTDAEAAALVGIDDTTLYDWKQIPEFAEAIKGAVAARLLIRLKRIEAGENGWMGTAWATERMYPFRFSRPEVMLQFQKNGEGEVKEVLDAKEQFIQDLAVVTGNKKPLQYGQR